MINRPRTRSTNAALGGLSGTVPIANGGTAATTADSAVTNLFGGYTGTGDAVRATGPEIDYGSVAGGRYTSGVITATGSISGTTLTLTGVSQLNVGPGMVVAGTGITTGTKIVSFQTGTSGGDGTYAIDTSHGSVGPVSVTIQGWADWTVIGRLAVSTTASAGALYDTGDLNIYNGTSAGAQLILRSDYALGPATNCYIQFSNDLSDQDMVIALNNSLQTAFSGERGGYIAMNYGSWQLVTNYQTASPRTWMHLNGVTKGAAEGRFGWGGITNPSYDYTFGAQDNTSTTDLVVTRASQDYGVKITNTGTTGNNTIGTFGSGSNLTISAAGTLALTAPDIGAATGLSASLTPNSSGSPNTNRAVNTLQYASGTVAGPTSLNLAKIFSDDINATNSGGSDYFVEGWTHEHYFGGSSVRGGRNGLTSYLYLTSPTNSGSDNRNYCAIAGVATASDDDGGSGTASGTSKGAFFGLGGVGVAANGAVNLHNMTGAEFNVAMQTGSSVYAKSLIQLSGRNDDAVQGSGVDAMIWAYKQTSTATAWTDGILFDYPADANSFPFTSSSTVLRTGAGTIGVGIDFSGTTVNSYAFKSPAFSVSGTGALVALSGSFASGALTIANDSNGALSLGGVNKSPYIDFNSYNGTANDYDVRVQVTGGTGSSGNGTLTITSAEQVLSGTAFLKFGGTTSSYAAIKQGGNYLYVKLADDSAFTGIAALLFQTTTALITSTGASTPSFGTNFVGGTGGPTTAAQNGWMKMLDSAGATVWVPVWK